MMVEWANAIQISMIGGALVFAYIASTIKISEKFDNGIKLLFYIFSILMVIGSTVENYPILNYKNPSLTNETYLGRVLTGTLSAEIAIISFVILLLIVMLLISIGSLIKRKKEEAQYGKPD